MSFFIGQYVSRALTRLERLRQIRAEADYGSQTSDSVRVEGIVIDCNATIVKVVFGSTCYNYPFTIACRDLVDEGEFDLLSVNHAKNRCFGRPEWQVVDGIDDLVIEPIEVNWKEEGF